MMPTSDRGSDGVPLGGRSAVAIPWRERAASGRLSGRRGGFTLIELLVVLAIVAIASSLVVVSLRDSAQAHLDEEAERLAALLESARTEARAAGITVRWQLALPDASNGEQFMFVGLPRSSRLPTRWLRDGVSAEILGARAVLLGPEPVLPAQRIVLRRDERRAMLATDGLGPFALSPMPAQTP
jgi:general secretion pathway protein H